MPRVTCLPDAVEIPVADDATLLDAMVREGVPVAHACGGNARCSTCRVRVLAGLEHCAPRTDDETAIACRLRFDPETRLACTTRVDGDVRVRRLVIDARDEQLVTQVGPGAVANAAVGRVASLAILFADIAGFTSMAERLPPYDVVHLLNRYFDQVGRPIGRHGGCVANYMGDGLLALFGHDDPRGGAFAAVRAGLEMLAEAEDLDAYTRELYGLRFGIRVGIHFGAVVVGDLGAGRSRRESVIGDAVNVASRIEAANKELGSRLLVSAAVLEIVREAVVTDRSLDVVLKGRSGRHALHEVTALA